MVERKNRSASRKNRKNRKVSRNNRKNRMVSRKNSRRSDRRSRRMSGGGDYSLAQGTQFAGYHSNQHGGAAVLAGAPLDYTGTLDAGLRDSARVGGYDKFFNEASGMSDGTPATVNITQSPQAGGSRSSKRKNRSSKRKNRSSKRKNRSSKRKNRSSKRKNSSSKRKNRSSKRNAKKNRSSMRKRRAQRGGQSPVDAPTMLLSRDAAMRAGTGDFSNPLLKH